MTDQEKNDNLPATEKDGEGLSFFQKMKAEQAEQRALIPVETFVDTLNKEHGELAARKYYSLFFTIAPVDSGDVWRPPLITIASQKGNEEALANAGKGGLYYHDSKKAVSRDTLFFPLFSHVEHTWWSDSKSLCRSVDALKGDRFSGALSGTTVDCGSESCPNVPDQFQKGDDECKWTRSLYVVDQEFTNIYALSLRYFSVKETHDLMLKATKKAGVKFDPNNSCWFTLGTFEKGQDNRKGWYMKSSETDQAVSEADGSIIAQLKNWMSMYQESRITARDNKTVNAQAEVDTIDVQTTVQEDGSAFTSM